MHNYLLTPIYLHVYMHIYMRVHTLSTIVITVLSILTQRVTLLKQLEINSEDIRSTIEELNIHEESEEQNYDMLVFLLSRDGGRGGGCTIKKIFFLIFL